jgi:hypothetical protein
MDLITLYETFTQRRETPEVPQESMLFLCSVTNAPCVCLAPTGCVFLLLVYQVYRTFVRSVDRVVMPPSFYTTRLSRPDHPVPSVVDTLVR